VLKSLFSVQSKDLTGTLYVNSLSIHWVQLAKIVKSKGSASFRCLRAVIAAIALCMFVKVSTHKCFAVDHSKTCTVLVQSQMTAGTFKTTLTAEAIKMERLGGKSYLVARAPSWRVVFFNPANNKAMDMSFKQFLDHLCNWSAATKETRSVSDESLVGPNNSSKIGTVNCLGQKCVRYWMRDERGYWGECIILPTAKYPKEELMIMAKMLDFPRIFGIPISGKVMRKTATAKPGEPAGLLDFYDYNWAISTKSLKQDQTTNDNFTYPNKFQKVSREFDVTLDSAQRKRSDEAFELLEAPSKLESK